MRYNLLNNWPKITIEISNKPETLKNRIIHSYDNISDEVIWTIVCRELPELKDQVEKFLNS
jgi:uncharacterized protein with HEPN domain